MSWLDEIKKLSIEAIAALLGITIEHGQGGPCPKCGATRRSRSDRRPPVNFSEKDGRGVWRCHADGGCGAKGDAADLVAYALTNERFSGNPQTAEIRSWFEQNREAIAAKAGELVGSTALQPRKDPPPEGIEGFAGLSGPCHEEPDVAGYLQKRCLNAQILGTQFNIAALPLLVTAATTPQWAKLGARTWIELGYRLLVALFNALGQAVSVCTRRIIEGDGPKVLVPQGYRSSGLVMASPLAVRMLRGEVMPQGIGVVVVEGVTDFLTACLAWGNRYPIIGIYGGAWTAEIAARIPDGAHLDLWTDADPDGDKLAGGVAESVAGRCHCWRGRPDSILAEANDLNALLEFGYMPAEPFMGVKPMQVAAVQGTAQGPTSKTAIQEAGSSPGKAGTVGSLEKPLPTLEHAVEGLLRRLQSNESEGATLFPWPGGGTDKDSLDVEEIPAGALLPLEGGYKGPAWRRHTKSFGPLFPDRLVVLVSRTKKGKSGYVIQVIEGASRAGELGLYVSCEMGVEELVARMLALRARGDAERFPNGVPWSAVLRGGAPIKDVEAAAKSLVADCPNMYLWAPGGGERSALALRRMAQRIVDHGGGRPPLIVIDYIQRMAEGDDLRAAVRKLSDELRILSRPQGIGEEWPGAAVLAISTTARNNYRFFQTVQSLLIAAEGGMRVGSKNGKPALVYDEAVPLEGMGKESGELETDASLLLLLTTDKAFDAEDKLRSDDPWPGLVLCGANRHGPEGHVYMSFEPACGRFSERSKYELRQYLAAMNVLPDDDGGGRKKRGRRKRSGVGGRGGAGGTGSSSSGGGGVSGDGSADLMFQGDFGGSCDFSDLGPMAQDPEPPSAAPPAAAGSGDTDATDGETNEAAEAEQQQDVDDGQDKDGEEVEGQQQEQEEEQPEEQSQVEVDKDQQVEDGQEVEDDQS